MQVGLTQRVPWRRWLTWLGFWTLLGLVTATQLFLAGRQAAGPLFGWTETVSESLIDWYIWGVFAILVSRLKQRVPIDRMSWGYHFAFHVAASLLLALAHIGIAVPGHWAIRAFAGEPAPLLAAFVNGFASSYLWNVMVYWAVLAGIHGRDYYRDLQEHRVLAARLEARLAEARLQALTLQLRPHFLFNTLNAVAELIHEDPDTAERMVGRLSDLLRWTLDTDGAQEVPLARELELVDRYLEIERVRFPDRLQIRLDVAAEARAAAVPAMILLPLVENAVRHGVAARTGAGRGAVGVRAWRSGTALRLEVWDDGPGLAAAPRSGAGSGIGLSNTAARLEQLYGREQRLELENGAAGGLTVRVTLPFRGGAAA